MAGLSTTGSNDSQISGKACMLATTTVLVIFGAAFGYFWLAEHGSAFGIEPHYHPWDPSYLDPGGQYPGDIVEDRTPASHPKWHGMPNSEAGVLIGVLLALGSALGVAIISAATSSAKTFFANWGKPKETDSISMDSLVLNDDDNNIKPVLGQG